MSSKQPDTVSVGDLNKRLGAVLDRVLQGERLIVCRHGRPVATLEPLGEPAPTPELTDFQTELLSDCIQLGRIITSRISTPQPATDMGRELFDLETLGLAVRKRGWGLHLTGLGLSARERLLERAGQDAFRCYLGNPAILNRPYEDREDRQAL